MPKTSCVYLAKLAAAQLDKLLLYKRSITDPLTGLHAAGHFHDALGRGVELVQRGLLPALPGRRRRARRLLRAPFGLILADTIISAGSTTLTATPWATRSDPDGGGGQPAASRSPSWPPGWGGRPLRPCSWPDGSPLGLAPPRPRPSARKSPACPSPVRSRAKNSPSRPARPGRLPQGSGRPPVQGSPDRAGPLGPAKGGQGPGHGQDPGSANRHFPSRPPPGRGRLRKLDALPLGRLPYRGDADAREGQRFLIRAAAEDA